MPPTRNIIPRKYQRGSHLSCNPIGEIFQLPDAWNSFVFSVYYGQILLALPVYCPKIHHQSFERSKPWEEDGHD